MDDKSAKEMIEAKQAEVYDAEKAEQETKEIEKIVEDKVMSDEKKEVKVEIVKDATDTLGNKLMAIAKGEIKEFTVKAATGLNETTAADGGNLVTHGITQLWDFAQQGAVIAPKCQEIAVPPNNNGMKVPYLDNSGSISRTSTPRGYWISEAGQKVATKFGFGQHDLSLGKLIFYVPMTDEIIEDVNYLESWVASYISGSRVGWMVDDAILNLATTTSGMIGLFDAGGANFITTPVAHNATYTGGIVHSIISGVMPSLRGGSEWYMSNSTWAEIQADIGGGVTASTVPLVDVNMNRLAGYNVNIMEQMAAFGSTGDILFGNFGVGYKLIKKGDVKIDVSKDVRFEYDETVYRFVLRIAGAPVVREQTLPDGNTVAAFATTSK
jgi:HK97 family phage major capsid protein